MTVPNTTESTSYPGSGTTGPFALTFKIYDDTQLTVYTINDSSGAKTNLALTTDYTVSGAGTDSASIATTSSVASGNTLYIFRNVPFTQGATWKSQASFDVSKLEDAVDKADMRDLQLKRRTDRALRAPDIDDPSSVNLELPPALNRKNTYPYFDNSGNLTTVSTITSTTIPPGTIIQVVDTIAALKAVTVAPTFTTYYVRGYFSAGDGGGGYFRYNSGDSSSDNSGTIIQPNSGTGRWNRIFDGRPNVLWFGAKADGSTDDSSAFNNCATYTASIGTSAVFDVPGNRTYAIASQIVLPSAQNAGMVSVGGVAIIKYTGSTMDTGTQDNSTGAMVLFSGTDHEFGGLEGFQLDANGKANFCVYAAGFIGSGFKLRFLHLKNAQLDCIKCDPSGSTGPLCLAWDHLSAFPAASQFGGTAICGRYVINLNMNMSSGIAVLRDCNFDNGISGFVAIQGATFAGNHVILENVRMEVNQNNQDLIILNYTSGSPGMVVIRNCKSIVATGSIRDYIRNISASSLRPVILIDPMLSNDTMTNIYADDNNSAYTVPVDNVRLENRLLLLNNHNKVGQLPIASAEASSPLAGEFRYYQGQLIVYDGSALQYLTVGRRIYQSSASTPYNIVASDHDRCVTNNLTANITYNLPAVSSVGNGMRVHFFCAQAGVITVAPNGTDKIRGSNTNIVSNNAANQSLELESSPVGWRIISSVGTWT